MCLLMYFVLSRLITGWALCSQGVTEMTGFLSSGSWSASRCVLQRCCAKNKASQSWYKVFIFCFVCVVKAIFVVS